jgi:hypothetical protein
MKRLLLLIVFLSTCFVLSAENELIDTAKVDTLFSKYLNTKDEVIQVYSETKDVVIKITEDLKNGSNVVAEDAKQVIEVINDLLNTKK